MTPRRDGALVVDKPSGLTSHDVVARVRRILEVKAGHTGTLDPLATGVLPLLLGKATRLMRFYVGEDKVYDAEIRLGLATETYDSEGAATSVKPVPELTSEQARLALAGFLGVQEQLPPMHSAVKVAGQPLYKAARRGEVVARKPRRIEIHSLELLSKRKSDWKIRIHCSTGTYVRSLAHDLGERIGCGAHLSGLRRLRSGPFDLSRAVALDEVATLGPARILPIERLLPQFPALQLDDQQSTRIRHGNAIPITNPGDRFRLFSEGRLLALAERRGDAAAPIVVFESA